MKRSDPLSAQFLLNALYGVLFIEGFGYFHHRVLEHGLILDWLPRRGRLRGAFARITERHAIHHSKLYPPGNLRPDRVYATQDLLSWYLPGLAITAGVMLFLPWTFGLPFAIGGWGYGVTVDFVHRAFHKPRHILAKNRVFLAMQRVHDLHHVDQRYNFTIVVPVLDVLGKSFRSAR
ncbi:MAG: hypothetical protein ACXVBC_11805 [Bdellovibrionota bacterium]